MIIAGLTGSIGMGKSTVGQMFRDLGVTVLDSDAVVHALYAKGGAAVAPVAALFPEALAEGAINRARLSAAVVGKPDAMKQLEAIVHPLVRRAQLDFIEENRRQGRPLVILDIPLLFEIGAQSRVDHIIVVSAPADVQRRRVLARPGMSVEKFEKILASQMPDADKRQKADWVIDTSADLETTRAQVRKVFKQLTEPNGT